jgi:hypothetical protein
MEGLTRWYETKSNIVHCIWTVVDERVIAKGRGLVLEGIINHIKESIGFLLRLVGNLS